ncbi:MAG: NTP transferase domain-containing protein [Solirubrobacterales bacterium]|nr:NTP transferase domain-containing protein [Solirubrobacterales bacterium]
MSERPPVAILCGGRGTRLRADAASLPKPLVEIGGRPILWHVIQIYLAQGFERFYLLTGYQAEAVEQFAAATDWGSAQVACIETGLDTQTGGRLARAAGALGDGTVCVTYADGVADIDLAGLLAHHRSEGRSATVTVVRPELQFGVAELAEDGAVRGFIEKPRSERWVNGGFFCFEAGVLAQIPPDAALERGPLSTLAAERQLSAFRHQGFWKCMDTYKDAAELNDLWASGEAPWKLWN